MQAELLKNAWRNVDVKLSIDGDLHVLRWRRGWFFDRVLFDDRVVATSSGLFGRETLYGLDMRTEDDTPLRMLFTIDARESEWDMSGEGKPRGVRLETADTVLLAHGSLGPDRAEPFRQIYDRAIKALGLA